MMRLVHGLLFLSLFLAVAGGRRITLEGEWTPIKDLRDPHVKDYIAVFAVAEHFKQSGGKWEQMLRVTEVVKGDTQAAVDGGTNYRLILQATRVGVSMPPWNYEVVVWERNWELNLTFFKAV